MSDLDSILETRLQALVPPLSGPWDNVVSRAQELHVARRRRRIAFALIAATVALVAGTSLAIGNRVFGWFEVSRSPSTVPLYSGAHPAYITHDVLHLPGRPAQRLSHPLAAPLLGDDAALAVPSPDGRYVAYHSWRWTGPTQGVPLLFVHDLRTGRDELLARGAQGVAWGRDGRIAYFQAVKDEYRHGPYLGRIVVRSLGTPPVAWTPRAGLFGVLGWARGKLLVGTGSCYYPSCGASPEPGAYILDPDGTLSPLPSAIEVLSPDGRRGVGVYIPVPGQDSPSSVLRLVDLEQRRVLATLDLSHSIGTTANPTPTLSGGFGALGWRGDEIVAGSSFGGGDAVIFLRATKRRLLFEDVLRIPRSALGVRHGVFFGPPSFLGKGTRRVIVQISGETTSGRYVTAVLTCDRDTRRCVRGRLLPSRSTFAVVANPSRPSR